MTVKGLTAVNSKTLNNIGEILAKIGKIGTKIGIHHKKILSKIGMISENNRNDMTSYVTK